MSDSARIAAIGRTAAVRSTTGHGLRIPLIAFRLSLGLFLAISYVLCVGFDLIIPTNTMHEVWQRLLPGFVWLTWSSFLLGLVESFAWGLVRDAGIRLAIQLPLSTDHLMTTYANPKGIIP